MYIVPSWVPAVEAGLTQSPKPHTFSFATVTKTGLPRVRTCVVRGWLFDDKTTGVLLFTTDARSQKTIELDATGGIFEACFYFPGKVLTSDDPTRQDSFDPAEFSPTTSSTTPNTQTSSKKKSAPGIQIRLSGFAQTISPTRGWYPTMVPPNTASEQSLINKNSSTSLSSSASSSSSSSSTHISYNPDSNPQAYPIYSPKYVRAFRAQSKLCEKEDNSPKHIQSSPYDDSSNIIPVSKEKSSSRPETKTALLSSGSDSNTSSPGQDSPHLNNLNTTQPDQASPLTYPPHPPSQSEWDAEYHRIWSSLSPGAKSSFRRPSPGATLDDECRRQLDKLVRGVDGASDAKGLSNFAVVAMFVNDADVLIDGVGAAHRRNKTHRVMEDDWTEEEVCP